MSERRYTDDETAAIFRAAAEQNQLPRGQAPNEGGLTLAELQEIGGEVGISPDAVASAATALDIHREATQRTILGLPISVSRTVELNRRMTDQEWELLVVRLREVFKARGTTRSDGSLRQWTNGNLHVLLEPTESGQRLRFGTFNMAARASIRSGMMALGMSGVVAIAAAVSGSVMHAAPALVFTGTAGLAMIANGALRLPGWARLRGRQMEALAAGVATSPNATLPPATSGN